MDAIRAYLPTSGASFGPEAVTNMGKAFEGAIEALGVEPGDEGASARRSRGFIIHLAEIDGGLDARTMRDKVVMSFGGPTVVGTSA